MNGSPVCARQRMRHLPQVGPNEKPPNSPAAIQIADLEIDTIYSSPLPPDFKGLPKLYVCEFCLKFHKARSDLKKHLECDYVW